MTLYERVKHMKSVTQYKRAKKLHFKIEIL